MSVEALLSRLEGVQGNGPSYRAICPSHNSKNKTRSLSIKDCDDGRVLVKCFAGCAVEAVVGVLGLDLSDLMPERIGESLPKVRKPWTNREVGKALEAPLAQAFFLLAKVGRGARLSAAEVREAADVSQSCAALFQELTR